MSIRDAHRAISIIAATEEVADKILTIKQELIELDKRRQQTREALREVEKSDAIEEKKVWITIGSMLTKVEREKAQELLKNDQQQIENEINILRSKQKVLVNEHRDLEFLSPFRGTHLKALDKKEIDGLKANLPTL